MNLNFTIKGNTQIRDFFEGSNEYIPSSELIYLHEHPLINESFLRDIEVLVNKSALCLVKNNVKGSVLDKYISLTKDLGALLENINQESAPSIMMKLREVYKLSTSLLNQFNFK